MDIRKASRDILGFVLGGLFVATVLWCRFDGTGRPISGPIIRPASSSGHGLFPGYNFSWSSIEPSTKLQFAPCFTGHECARLRVPMSWDHPDRTDLDDVILAVIRRPASVPRSDDRYGGAIFTNPGGPAGSGVNQVLQRGKSIQDIVDGRDDDDATISGKYYDIVSFDPRGVGNSHPSLECFPDVFAERAWSVRGAGLEVIYGSENDAFPAMWSESEALAEACADGGIIGAYMGTRSVAYDLREVARQLDPETSRLQYWGFSYGTVLGMTFASLFPHNVGRMVLDGAVNTVDWYANRPETVFQGADEIMDRYFAYCAEAGRARCALATGSADDPKQIQRRVRDLLATLKDDPIAVGRTASRGPDIITYDDVKRLIRLALYDPIEQLPLLATLLADLEQGNGSRFADYKVEAADRDYNSSCLSETCQTDEACVDTCRMLNDFKNEKADAIKCVDVNVEIPAISRDEFYEKSVLPRIRDNFWTGDVTVHWGLSCLHWKVKSESPFTGRVGSNETLPILFTGNSRDFVTPIRNGYTMSTLFQGSAVLEQSAEGHCTYSAPSQCTNSHIRRYFQTGTLPKHGTVCEVDQKPFCEATIEKKHFVVQNPGASSQRKVQ